MMLWEPFVIPHGSAAAVDPGNVRSTAPPAMQHNEGGLPRQFHDDLYRHMQLIGAQPASWSA
jgi:hypothetical protein